VTKRKKIGLWIAGGLGALLLLLVIAVISLPLLVGHQQIRQRILSALSTGLGGEVEFDSIEASLFPPHGEIWGMRLKLADVSGTAGSVKAGFKILPLFRGRLKIDTIVIKDPNFTIPLPKPDAHESEETPKGLKEWTPERIGERISLLLSRIEASVPDLTIQVQKGSVSLTREGKPFYLLQNLDAEIAMPSEKLEIDLTSASNIWDSMTFKGKIDADGSNAGGELDATGIRPELLALYFAPGSLKDSASARVNLKLGFESERFEAIRGKVEGSAVYAKIPHRIEMTESDFVYSGENLVVTGFHIEAGKSKLGASSTRLGLKEAMSLNVESASADLDLAQTLPWAAPLLSQVEGLRDIEADYKGLKGMLSVSELDLHGPLRQPGQWIVSGKGAVENLSVEAKNLPASLSLERAEFAGTGERMTIKLQNLSLLSSLLSLSGNVENFLKDTAGADVSIQGEIGSKTIQWVAGKFDLPAQIKSVQGKAKINGLNVKGPIWRPKELFFKGSGAVEKLVIDSGLLPDPVAIGNGSFDIGPEALLLKDLSVGFLDASMTVSGSMKDYMKRLSSIDLKFKGAFGQKAAGWIKDRELVPSWLKIAAPVLLSDGHFTWGRNVQTVFAADLKPQDGPRLVLSLEHGSQGLAIKKLTVNDSQSEASMSMRFGEKIVDIDFKGQLADETVRKLIEGRTDQKDWIRGGWVRGDFNLHVPTQRPVESRIQGTIQAGGITYGEGLNAPVRVNELSAYAEGERIRIDSADLVWRQTDIDVNGSIVFSPKGVVLDLFASTEGFDWEKINRIVEEETQEEPKQTEKEREKLKEEGTFDALKLEGKVVVKADYFKYGDLTWKPFQVTLNLDKNRLGLQLTQGNLCGIQTEATAKVSPEPVQIEAEAAARDKSLGSSLNCFLESKLMSGEFDLAGEVTTRGTADNFIDNLQGQFSFTAEDGRIFRYGLLAKILAGVNITEILKGQAPDLKGEGFGYETAKASGVIENGILKLNETFIDGRSVDMAFSGSLDIAEKQIDLTVLVTPLKTVDSIIERIPILGHIAGKNFMAIPVRVRGDLSDPTVTPISASAVGKGLLGVLERTLKLPVRVVQPFLPEQGKE